MLLGAVYNVSHAFLDSPILRVHAIDAGKIFRLLHLPIEEIDVFSVPLGADLRPAA
jgi:hypothetical protein